MADLMLFPPSWYSGPPDPPEPLEDDSVPWDDVLLTCRHNEGPDCPECAALNQDVPRSGAQSVPVR